MIVRRRVLPALMLSLALSFSLSLILAGAGFPPSSSIACPDAVVIDARATHRIHNHLLGLLNQSTFFSVFSVALDKQCPFWESNLQCVIRECTVCHCADSEVPPAWLHEDSSAGQCRDGESCTKKDDKLNNVDRSLTGLAALVGQPVWHTADEDNWIVRDDESETVYVDLRNNPEQYTGYSGPSSLQVWEAIYDENCFTFSDKCRSGICDPDTCKEERVLYTLISGLHASISMHIAKRYLRGERWGVNTSIYEERLRDYPERISNLNVAYAVVLRAVSKASAALHPQNYSYVTGNERNDDFTRREVAKLFEFPLLRPGCEDKVFDESDMFLQKNEYTLSEFRSAFRNISMIMDCVGCEKCRLWGKLQFLGLGTALRILFEDDMPELERNEAIALINLLFKLSSSVIWVDKMEEMINRQARINVKVGAVLGVLALCIMSWRLGTRKSKMVQAKRGADIPAHKRVGHSEKSEQRIDSASGELAQKSNSRSDRVRNRKKT